MLLFVKSAKFRKKLNLQKNTQAKKRAKVSASPQTATPRHFRHASGKKSEGLGITTNRHPTPFKARKRKKEAKVSDIATFLRHESGHYRQKTSAKSSPRHARASGGNGAVVRDKR